MKNRLEILYEKMPFTFCVVVTRNMWGKHSAIIADFKQLKKFYYEASEGRINFELRLSRFNKLYPIINTIGELEMTEDEQEWLLKNKSKFKEINTKHGTIYETPNISFRDNYHAINGRVVGL